MEIFDTKEFETITDQIEVDVEFGYDVIGAGYKRSINGYPILGIGLRRVMDNLTFHQKYWTHSGGWDGIFYNNLKTLGIYVGTYASYSEILNFARDVVVPTISKGGFRIVGIHRGVCK
ncbi:MAG: hypothetical protein ACRDFB_00935 [Rhabdochlamydiaceae bacterium]